MVVCKDMFEDVKELLYSFERPRDSILEWGPAETVYPCHLMLPTLLCSWRKQLTIGAKRRELGP
jgi:hypothetical protein